MTNLTIAQKIAQFDRNVVQIGGKSTDRALSTAKLNLEFVDAFTTSGQMLSRASLRINGKVDQERLNSAVMTWLLHKGASENLTVRAISALKDGAILYADDTSALEDAVKSVESANAEKEAEDILLGNKIPTFDALIKRRNSAIKAGTPASVADEKLRELSDALVAYLNA